MSSSRWTNRILRFSRCSPLNIGPLLAAVAVENIQEDEDLCHVESYGNIGAKEPRGDPVRAYVAVGFGVLWRLRGHCAEGR